MHLHIDKAWRKGLNVNVKKNKDRIEIYHHLRLVLQEVDPAHFQVLLQQLISFLKDKFADFYCYFNVNYVSITSKWAFCYRVRSGINTNMFVEAFHRKLKTVYLQKKQNRRIDKLVFTLLKIARDIAFEGLRKEEVGKRTHRICEVTKRCLAAKKMMTDGIKAVITDKENSWHVKSSMRQEVLYVVTVNKKVCDCLFKCRNCRACVHMYTCTCVDHAVHFTVCKHAHLVHTQLVDQDDQEFIKVLTEMSQYNEDDTAMGGGSGNAEGDSHNAEQSELEFRSGNESEADEVENESTLEYYERILQSNKTGNVLESKRLFEQKIAELQVLVESCSDSATIESVCSHLNSAICVVKAVQKQQGQSTTEAAFVSLKRPAPNSNSEVQLRFHSTKRKKQAKQT